MSQNEYSLRGLTWADLDTEGALGDWLGGEVDVDGVHADLVSQVLAAPLALLHLLQLQHGRVLLALGVEDDHLRRALAGIWGQKRRRSGLPAATEAPGHTLERPA